MPMTTQYSNSVSIVRPFDKFQGPPQIHGHGLGYGLKWPFTAPLFFPVSLELDVLCAHHMFSAGTICGSSQCPHGDG